MDFEGGASRTTSENWTKRQRYASIGLTPTQLKREAEVFSLFGTPRTYASTIVDDGVVKNGTTRKERIVSTLDGNPTKGTCVVSIRGTQDFEDFTADLNFGSAITPVKQSLRGTPYYESIRKHVETVLTTQFARPDSSLTYKNSWDVFSTGHSLGGAIAEQLIVDGVTKGGMSFAAPRTKLTDQLRPAYSIISTGDSVIARTGLADTSIYDFANPNYTKYGPDSEGIIKQAPGHGHDLISLGTIQSGDKGPLWNEDYFWYGKAEDPTTEAVEEEPPEPDVDPSELGPVEGLPYTPSMFKKIKSLLGFGYSGSRYSGSGPAPKADYMRRMARNVYKPYRQTLQNFANEGLEIPDYRMTKSDGQTIVQFYIISTPTNYVEYYHQPVYQLIKKQLTTLAEGQDPTRIARFKNILATQASI
jgi:hypothetical protein